MEEREVRLAQARWLLFAGILAVALAAAGPISARSSPTVALELVLAVDTSASVDDDEYALQMRGIAEALRDPDVVAAIESHGQSGLAIAMIHWSTWPRVVIPWIRISTARDAALLARLIERLDRINVGVTTGIGSAMALSLDMLANNAFDGRRQSIDISGDGRNNAGRPLWIARNRAASAGVTVNGLAVVGDDPSIHAYYRDRVIAGPGAFVIAAKDFHHFAAAFRIKLLREIRSQVARETPDDFGHPAGPVRFYSQ